MGLFNRLRKVGSGVIKARLSGDDASETQLDALAEAELEAEISGVWKRPAIKPARTGAQPAPTLPASAPVVDAAEAEAPVVEGPAGKRSL